VETTVALCCDVGNVGCDRLHRVDAAYGRRYISAVMAGSVDSPIAFLDVDGTLLPFRTRPAVPALPRTGRPVPGTGAEDNPLLERLDPADGPKLLALRCQLVWATTWMTDANDIIAPRLGLPQLPIVDFSDDDEPENGLHWKTAHLARWAAGRPFVWLDDEITDTDHRWIQIHYPGKALLHRVDPSAGLAHRDFTEIREWLAALQNLVISSTIVP
jgi:hypothetical protein